MCSFYDGLIIIRSFKMWEQHCVDGEFQEMPSINNSVSYSNKVLTLEILFFVIIAIFRLWTHVNVRKANKTKTIPYPFKSYLSVKKFPALQAG